MLTSTCFKNANIQPTCPNPYTETQIGSLEYANTDRHTHKHLCANARFKKFADLPVLSVSSGFFTAVLIVVMCVGWDPCSLAAFDWEPDSCILKVDT